MIDNPVVGWRFSVYPDAVKGKMGSTNWPLCGFSRTLALLRELATQSEDYLEAQLQVEVSKEVLELSSVDDEDEPVRNPPLETEAHRQYAIDLPRLGRSAFLIVEMSAFEKRMNLVCDFVGMATGAKVSVDDLNGRGLQRARVFLERHTQVRECFKGDEWEAIQLFGEIRNCIVHAHSIPETRRANLIRRRDRIGTDLFSFGKEYFSHGDELVLGVSCLQVLSEKIDRFLCAFEAELVSNNAEILTSKHFLYNGGGGEEIEYPDL